MTDDYTALTASVQAVNSLIGTINKNLDTAAKGGEVDTTAIKKQVGDVQKAAEGIEAPKDQQPGKELSVTDYWGDSRYNPYFLQAAEYFGIDEKEYPIAVNKINEILRWAETETKSKDIREILKKISSTSKHLQSPGYGEKRYAILYRYIKLAKMKVGLEKEMKNYQK